MLFIYYTNQMTTYIIEQETWVKEKYFKNEEELINFLIKKKDEKNTSIISDIDIEPFSEEETNRVSKTEGYKNFKKAVSKLLN